MRSYLVLPSDEYILSLIRNYIEIKRIYNSFGKPCLAICFDISLLDGGKTSGLVADLTKIREYIISDLVSAIKDNDFSKLISSIMVLRTFISYCSDISKLIDNSMNDNILALATAKNIQKDLLLFSVEENNSNALLSNIDSIWFATQYYRMSKLRYGEIKDIQTKCDDHEVALPRSEQIFLDVYATMKEFIIIPQLSDMSNNVDSNIDPISYEDFCEEVSLQESVSQRLPNRELSSLVRDMAGKEKNNYFDFFQGLSNCCKYLLEPEDLKLYISSLNEEEKISLSSRIDLMMNALTDEDKNSRYSALTQSYLFEIKSTLELFSNALEGQVSKPSAIQHKSTERKLARQALATNIDAIETLSRGLLEYKASSGEKLKDAMQNNDQDQILILRRRNTLANILVNTSTDENMSVKQKVLTIHKNISDFSETVNRAKGEEELSGDSCKGEKSSPKQHWFAALCLHAGYLLKGLFCLDKEASLAYKAKAKNPEISADGAKLHMRFFKGAKALNMITPPPKFRP